jgi:ComF family protein
MECLGETPLAGVFAVLDYHNPLVKECIHTYKYNSIESLAKPLGKKMIDILSHTEIPLPDLLIPIPLHPLRYRYRGFNQSEFLAREIATHLTPSFSYPLSTDILKRSQLTKPQASLKNKEQRVSNLKDVFTLDTEKAHILKEKSIWLIDDVSTTNTTLTQASIPLKKAGAKEVWGIVLAR